MLQDEFMVTYWEQWIKESPKEEILKFQVPHNITYWIRHDKVCWHKNCQFKGYKALQLTREKIKHLGYGLCFDCYEKYGESYKRKKR